MADKIELHTMDKINLYSTDDTSEAIYRRIAVEAVLELIRSAVRAEGEKVSLYSEMNNLDRYADLIQNALKVKQQA